VELKALIEDLPITCISGDCDLSISDLTDDSRNAAPGTLFIARTGSSEDGKKYISDAVNRGAAAILTDSRESVNEFDGVTILHSDQVDQSLAGQVAERFFGHPAQELALIGITGTNGKTTTAFLVRHVLQHAGVKCGLIGTIQIDDGETTQTADLTTPGAIELSRMLARMVDNGCAAAVLEVSSHALHQGRTGALTFKVGVFTNLTGDHLDYHGTMDEYADAKAILFRSLPETSWAVVNADDPHYATIVDGCKAHKLWCTLDATREVEEHGCRAQNVKLRADGSYARFTGPWGSVAADLPLAGRHNVANALQAVAAASAITPLDRTLREALIICPAVPGRLEVVQSGNTDAPTVVVDYAHTHDALQNVLLALRPVTKGKLLVVFGCGGDRDNSKRPKMAAVACKFADRVYVTSDNPRTEDPNQIIEQIMEGVDIEQIGKVYKHVDRTTTISKAIRDATPNDSVLIAGKGHEDYQIIGTTKTHYDDREVAREILNTLQPKTGSAS